MLETKNLRFKYDNDSELSFPNIKTSKENLLILGASGVGKTTFLHLLSGLLKPLEGEIDLIGTPISKLTMSEMDRFRGKNIGIVFQKPHFINSLTEMTKWFFLLQESKYSKNLFESLGTDLKLDEFHGSPYVFIIDKKGFLRGRNDSDGIKFGYDMRSVAELNNYMVDDVKIILAEYRLALKKNNILDN